MSVLEARKIKMYDALYRFTRAQCDRCEATGCACKDTICRHVEEQNLKRGRRFERTGHALRFIGCRGCVVPPHLRETCTLYLCEAAQQKPGFDRARFERLKRICAKIEWRLMSGC